ncbi:MAG: NUDIX domain-containing protein [Candidatus Saliniplasma sp.]
MLKKDDKFILGQGRKKLLELVSETGSIKEAAKNMGMSYRHAWGIIKKIEENVGEEIVISRRGGQKGGGTSLSKFGQDLLKTYEDMRSTHRGDVYQNPSLTVDGIIESEGELLLIKRGNPPFKGKYAFPGGFVEYNETVENAVVREIKEETGLKTEIKQLVGVYSDPNRDPRGHTVSVVFSLRVIGGSLSSGSDAQSADYFSKDEIPRLAFDHDKIIKDYLLLSRD